MMVRVAQKPWLIGLKVLVHTNYLDDIYQSMTWPERIYNLIEAMGFYWGNGFFDNVYLSAGQHLEINIADTPLP